MASKAFRIGKCLAGGCALLLVATLAACGAPQFTYVADSSANAYFKVPYGWHQITPKALSAELQVASGSSSGAWMMAYDAGSAPSASHLINPDTTSPFAFAEIGQLNSTSSGNLSYNTLRDFFLPVTSTARQSAATSGFALTNFKSLRDDVLTPGQGVHGVRETFQYSYPSNGGTQTFDQVALTNADQTEVYFLLVHCLSTCYSQHQDEIDTVMSSFTVRSS